MKIKYVLLLITLSVITGCCFNLVGKDYNKCGCPLCGYMTSKQTLKNGNTLYTYKKLCDDKINWKKTTEEVSPENIIVKVNYISNCPIYTDIVGDNFDTYVQKNGVPINEYTLQNGNKLYSYRTLCADKTNWLEYNIEVSQQNTIIQRKDVKICPI